MPDKTRPPEQGDVTVQPAISTDEAAKTDEVLSPVGDDKVRLPTNEPERLEDISENG